MQQNLQSCASFVISICALTNQSNCNIHLISMSSHVTSNIEFLLLLHIHKMQIILTIK